MLKKPRNFLLKDTNYSLEYNFFDSVTSSTSLMYACSNKRIDDALKILEQNHNNEFINHVNKYGMTALMYAVCFPDTTELIESLIKNGANVNISDKNGRTAIIYAMRNYNEKALIQLLDNKAIVNYKFATGASPLLFAIEKKLNEHNSDFVNILIKYGAHVEYDDYIFIIKRINEEISSHYAEEYLQRNEKINNQVNTVIKLIQSGNKQEIIKFINTTDIYFNCYDLLSLLFEIEEQTLLQNNKYSEIIKKIENELDSFYAKNTVKDDKILLQIETLLQQLIDENDSAIINSVNQVDIYLTGFDLLYEMSNFKNKIKKKENFMYSSINDIPHLEKTQRYKKESTSNKKIKSRMQFLYTSIERFVRSERYGWRR